MKSTLFKDTLRELWRTKSRFLSIFTIIALGVGFFAGLKATSSYMLSTADLYFSESSLFDVDLRSTVGFDEADMAAVTQTSRVSAVMPAYTLDALMDLNSAAMVVKVHSLPQPGAPLMNLPTLTQGRLPERSDECVIDMHLPGELGQSITLYSDAKQDPIEDTLSRDRYTIVGKVRTPYYITFERGSSTIGNGSINGFVMVPAENFILEVYTNLYVSAAEPQPLSAFSGDYTTLTDALVDSLEDTGRTRVQLRYEEIQQEGNEKIADAEKELADGIETQRKELADARKKIDDGNAELADARLTLAEKEQEYLDEIAKGEKELADAKKELADGHAKVSEASLQMREAQKDFQKIRSETDQQLAAAQAQLDQLKGNQAQLLQAAGAYQLLEGVKLLFPDASGAPPYPDPQTINDLAEQLAAVPQFNALAQGLRQLAGIIDKPARQPMLPGMIQGLLGQVGGAQKALADSAPGLELSTLTPDSLAAFLLAGQQQIDGGREALAAGGRELSEGLRELNKARREIEEADQKYADGVQELEDGKLEGRQKIADAKVEISDAQKKLEEGEQEYADGKRDSDIEIADARVKIDDAKKELADLAFPKWYVQSRDSLPGYSGYEENAQRIDAIASVFPLFFLLVAVLVCLTTMTRMVEEHRTKIGTLKGLGYGSLSITGGFLFYALTASLLGTVVGLVVGFQLFPHIIYNAYGIMYTLPPLLSPFKWDYAAVAVVVVLLLTTVTVLAAGYKELVAVPATLMRPKAPKNGKRVLLERIPFLWKRMSFTQKVTMRNLLRYKKRMLMTVVGIAGCAALILTGFGIRDSISCIVSRQFGDIFLYDSLVILETDLTAADKEAVMAEAVQSGYTDKSVLLLQQSYTATLGKNKVEGYLFLPSNPAQLPDFVTLRHRRDRLPVTLNDEGVILSEKAAELLDASVGDQITLSNSDNEEFSVPILDITENYAGHYYYLTPALYERLTGKAPDYNAVLSTMPDDSLEVQNAFAKELLKDDHVIMVSYTATTRSTFTDMMKSLDYVVLVLILSAGALAFVVLYNLTNINIAERIREIATIKVLGFYDKEVSAYIYRENTLLTLMGTAAGLLLGILLHRFVINTAEVNMVMFGREVLPMSFVWAAGITIVFSLIVNLVMHFRLKRVSMVESLKSVE